jgi:hypothetical protein
MIAYTLAGIVISDDRDPSRAPLLLPLGATSAEVEAAAATYLGPPTDPDWTQFRQALRTENGFSAAFQAAMAADPMAGIALALGLDNFRRDGDPRDFVDALHNAFATLSPDQGAYITGELLALAQRCNLPQEFLDALGG